MVRTQIQLSEDQHRRLKRLAQRLGISLAEAVRRCVADRLGREESRGDRAAMLAAALEVCGRHRDPAGASRVAAHHDRHLAEAWGR